MAHKAWLGVPMLAFLTLALPAAAADPQIPYLGEEPGPCYQACVVLPPLTQDPAPHGADTTKLQVGGDCPRGGYGVACETNQCTGTWWVAGPCDGTTTCTFYARSTCVNGNNQGKIWNFVTYVPRQDHVPLPPAPHVAAPEVGAGGNCANHSAAAACNYHTDSSDTCFGLNPLEPSSCPPRMFCTVYALGDCQDAEWANPQRGIGCAFTQSLCAQACDDLADLSVTICSPGT